MLLEYSTAGRGCTDPLIDLISLSMSRQSDRGQAGAARQSMKPFPDVLATERLILLPPTAADADHVLAAVTASYPELHRWMSWAHGPFGIEQAREFCADAKDRFEDGRDFTALLTLADDDTLVGVASIMVRDEAVPSFEIAYWVHTDHAGHGYATEATAALTQLAFDDCGGRRVELRIDERNRRSQAVAQRLGFEHEATLKSHRRDNGGRLGSTLIYAMFDLRALRSG